MDKKAKSKLMQFGILLAVLLICIPFIHSAGETVVYTKSNETISIKAVGGTSAIDLQLIENSYQCGGTSCYAIIKITPKVSVNTALTATATTYNWTFRQDTKTGKTKTIPYVLYSNTTYANGSVAYTKPADLSNFNFESGKTYYFRLEGTIPKGSTVEWIPVFYGFELNQWASWTAGSDGTGGTYEMACNASNYMSWKTSGGVNYMAVMGLKGSDLGVNIYNYTLGWHSQGGNGNMGGAMNNTHMWYFYPSDGSIREHNLKTGNEVIAFDGTNWGAPAATATGITTDVNGIDGVPSWFMIMFDNGSLINYSASWVQTNAWNITNIIAPSKIFDVIALNWRGISYNQSDYFIGWHGNRSFGTSWIYHLSSTMANISDGFNTSSDGFFFQVCVNNNNTLFVEQRVGGVGVVTPYYYNYNTPSVVNSSLNQPANATNSTSTRIINFTVDSLASGSLTLGSAQLFIYNATSQAIYYTNIKTITGTENQSSWVLTMPTTATSEKYFWNVRVNNSDDTEIDYDTNYTLWIDISLSIVSYILYPLDNNFSNSQTINFTCGSSASSGSLGNITLKIYNKTSEAVLFSNSTNVTGTTNQTSWKLPLLYDGSYKWNCQVNNSDGSIATWGDNKSLSVDTIKPFVAIISPANNTEYLHSSSPLTFNVNYERTDTNIFSCFYSLNSDTNTSMTNCNNITTGSALVSGWNALRVYANDSAGNMNMSGIRFYANLYNVSNFYDSSFQEGENHTFMLQINATNLTLLNSNATFYFNNTAYPVHNVNKAGNQVNYTRTFIIPSAPAAVSQMGFYWDYNVSDANLTELQTANTTIVVSTFSIDDCSSATKYTLNFTTRDEANSSVINASTVTTITYWTSQQLVNKSTSMYTYTNSYNHTFCINPAFAATNASVITSYAKTGYTTRTYTNSFLALSNVTTQINLYLSQLTSTCTATVTTGTNTGTAISDVKVELFKVLNGSYMNLDTKYTDDAGVSQFSLINGDDYYLTLIKIGYTTVSLFRITSCNTYPFYLSGSTAITNVSMLSGIKEDFGPKNNQLDNGTNYGFWYNISSVNSTLENFYLWLSSENATLLYNITTTSPTGGNISATLNTNNYTTLTMIYGYTINGVPYNKTVTYKIFESYQGQFSAMTFLDDIRNFARGGFGDFERTIIAYILILLITGGISIYLDAHDIVTLSVTMMILTIMFTWLGFIKLNVAISTTFIALCLGVIIWRLQQQ